MPAGALGCLGVAELGDDFTGPQVSHEAVGLAGIADTGFILSLLSGRSAEQRHEASSVAQEFRRTDLAR